MTSLSSPTKNGQKKDVFIQGIIFPTQAHKLNENCLNYIFTTFFCHINDIAMFNLVCKDWYKFLSENIYLCKKISLKKQFPRGAHVTCLRCAEMGKTAKCVAT